MRRRTFLSVERMEGRALLSGLSYSLTTDQSVYQVGQPVEMTLTVTNTSNATLPFEYGPSGDGFIVTQDGQTVWQSNAGVNPEILVDDPLQPGQSWSTQVQWDATITDGTATTTDSFTVTNQMDPGGASATFQVPLTYSLAQPPASTAFGQPIPLSYTVTNTSDRPVTFNLPATDFIVTTPYGGTVWESDPGAASQPATSQTLQPGHSLTEMATWNGVASEGTLAGTDVWGPLNVSLLGASTGFAQGFWLKSPLAVNVTTDQQRYEYGTPVQITATETNTSDQPVTMLTTDASFKIRGDGGVTLPAQPVSASGTIVTLQPGQSLTFTATWDTSGLQTPPFFSQQFDASFQNRADWAESPAFYVSFPPPPVTSPPPTAPTPPPPATNPNPPVFTPPAGLMGGNAAPANPTASSASSASSSPSSTTPAAPVAALVAATPLRGRGGNRVRIKLALRNNSAASVHLARSSRLAEITVREGSTVIATETKDLFRAKAMTLKPGRSLQLSTVWSDTPTRADRMPLNAGLYTIEVDAGGYTASVSIQLGGASASSGNLKHGRG